MQIFYIFYLSVETMYKSYLRSYAEKNVSADVKKTKEVNVNTKKRLIKSHSVHSEELKKIH